MPQCACRGSVWIAEQLQVLDIFATKQSNNHQSLSTLFYLWLKTSIAVMLAYCTYIEHKDMSLLSLLWARKSLGELFTWSCWELTDELHSSSSADELYQNVICFYNLLNATSHFRFLVSAVFSNFIPSHPSSFFVCLFISI